MVQLFKPVFSDSIRDYFPCQWELDRLLQLMRNSSVTLWAPNVSQWDAELTNIAPRSCVFMSMMLGLPTCVCETLVFWQQVCCDTKVNSGALCLFGFNEKWRSVSCFCWRSETIGWICCCDVRATRLELSLWSRSIEMLPEYELIYTDAWRQTLHKRMLSGLKCCLWGSVGEKTASVGSCTCQHQWKAKWGFRPFLRKRYCDCSFEQCEVVTATCIDKARERRLSCSGGEAVPPPRMEF